MSKLSKVRDVNEIFETYKEDEESYKTPYEAKKSIEEYSKDIDGNRGTYNSHIMRGIAYFYLAIKDDDNFNEFIDMAIKDFIRASEILKIAPSKVIALLYIAPRAIALFYIGRCCFWKDQHEKAIEYYTAAIELEPRFIEAYEYRRYRYKMFEMYEEARADLYKICELKEAQNAKADS